jgi:hypothetical protein
MRVINMLEAVMNVLMIFVGRHLVLSTYTVKFNAEVLMIAACGIFMLVMGMGGMAIIGTNMFLHGKKIAEL